MRLMDSPIKNARRQPSVLNKSRWSSEVITGSINRSHYDKYSKNTQLRQRYTLFRDAYHLAGIDMPDFEREDDWWRNGQNLYLDNMAVTGFYRVPLSSAQAGDILLCCFGASVANHAAIYCGNGELLHHLPEQLSKRERYSEKWQRRTHSVWRHRHWHASAFTGIYNDLAAASACM